MSAHTIIPLEEFEKNPKSNLGERATFLNYLNKNNVKVSKSACIPSTTLGYIIEKTTLEKKLSKAITETKGLTEAVIYKKINSVFHSITLPKKILSEIHTFYNYYFSHAFVRVFSSNADVETLSLIHI